MSYLYDSEHMLLSVGDIVYIRKGIHAASVLATIKLATIIHIDLHNTMCELIPLREDGLDVLERYVHFLSPGKLMKLSDDQIVELKLTGRIT